MGLLIPRGAPIAHGSALARAAATGRRERAREPLPGDADRRFHVEAKSYPTGRGSGVRERVLALAWPAREAGDADGADDPARSSTV